MAPSTMMETITLVQSKEMSGPNKARLLVWNSRPGSRLGGLGVDGNGIAPISEKTVIEDLSLHFLMKVFSGAFGKGIEKLQVLF